MDVNSAYYNIELKEIRVAGKPLKLKPRIFDRNHGTVLDSGTTYAYLPKEAFHAFKSAVRPTSSICMPYMSDAKCINAFQLYFFL